jgi:hypothetical protein
VGLFWLAQVLGGLALDYVWIEARYPWRAHVYERLKECPHPPEILFLGSSRFEGNLSCPVLDAALRRDLGAEAPRTFNAAVPVGDPTVAERILEDLFRQGYRPKLVVVEVSPETLARRDNWLYQHALRLLEWRDVPEALPALCRNGRIMYLFRGRLLPLCTHRYLICKEAIAGVSSLFHPVPRTPACDMEVGEPVESDPEPPELTPATVALMEAAYRGLGRELQDYRVGGVSSHRLERLLERCRSQGVAVLLLGVPVSSPHRRAYTPEVDERYRDYLRELTQRYGCTYSDWRDALPDEYFTDNHHVHPEGAVYFSRRLAPAVLVPLWRDLLHSGSLPASLPGPITSRPSAAPCPARPAAPPPGAA